MSIMEGIFIETLTIGFGVAFTATLVLIAVAAGLLLASMGEAEKAGARLFWVESPITGTLEAEPPVEARERLAA
ncbi:MAG: hypothetical protein ACM319_04890 [Deltaproteobacteria bacterium]